MSNSFEKNIETKVLGFNDNPDLADDIAALEGHVIHLRTGEGGNYMVAVRNGKFVRVWEADPTIWFESTEQVILDIVDGKLDPLVAMNTRKLLARTDAPRGRILRRIFYGEDF